MIVREMAAFAGWGWKPWRRRSCAVRARIITESLLAQPGLLALTTTTLAKDIKEKYGCSPQTAYRIIVNARQSAGLAQTKP